ncbi:MAG TPA: arginine repressor [Thermoanaerobaculia bacterium]|nr:arginine repressor [Thermoanaerobaculia bacterium]
MHKYALIVNKYSSPPDVQTRRQTILAIIRKESVHSQDELLALLAAKGVVVTQPTLSRDMRELGLAKTPSGYVSPETLTGSVAAIHPFVSEEKKERRLGLTFQQYVKSVERAGNLLVIKTGPADAHPVARALDEAALDGILGTIAGDDTIFLAIRTTAATRLTRQLSVYLQPPEQKRLARA